MFPWKLRADCKCGIEISAGNVHDDLADDEILEARHAKALFRSERCEIVDGLNGAQERQGFTLYLVAHDLRSGGISGIPCPVRLIVQPAAPIEGRMGLVLEHEHDKPRRRERGVIDAAGEIDAAQSMR